MRVLDAGCGGARFYATYENAHVVGLDLDRAALARNTDIDEAIVGDIMTHPFEPESFDVILCHDVLEHLADPERALANFAKWLRPGGRILLGFPNVESPKGVITKFTPHAFHLWFYRHVLGSKLAGTPGYGPYKTYLHWSLRRSGIEETARRTGLTVESIRYESGGFRARSRVLQPLLDALQWRSECSVVLSKAA